MSKLTQEDFHYIKADLKHGRIAPGTIRYGLSVFLLVSGALVGIAYAVVTASNTVIGWENLSNFWQILFKIEAILFILQLILIICVKGRSNWSQMVLNVSYVIYAYKMALDPFVTLSMFAINDEVYEIYVSMILIVIIIGFIIHIYLIRRYFQRLKEEQADKNNEKKNRKGTVSFLILPIFFLLASITGFIIRNQLLGDMENLFILGACTVVFIGMMIGTIEFVIGAYCVIRFPSFRVNPPTEDNHQ